MRREVRPEFLDDLPPDDTQAIGSRKDLRRLNSIMRHANILSRASLRHLDSKPVRSRPLRMVELGSGDGTLLLQIARRLATAGMTGQVTLLDRQNLVSAETRRGFTALDWSVDIVTRDVFAWLNQSTEFADVMFANLFLHHFTDEQLKVLLQRAMARSNLFIACEPQRSPLALAATRLLGLIGCNHTTRHDAYISVRAGFVSQELSALWPADAHWKLAENPIGLFSHSFIAKQDA